MHAATVQSPPSMVSEMVSALLLHYFNTTVRLTHTCVAGLPALCPISLCTSATQPPGHWFSSCPRAGTCSSPRADSSSPRANTHTQSTIYTAHIRRKSGAATAPRYITVSVTVTDAESANMPVPVSVASSPLSLTAAIQV